MSINTAIPDYELADRIVVTAPEQLRAMADPLRATILDLLLERAATVAELAAAVERPKSTVAHHVNVLVEAGMLRVVRTRRVRAIDERYYGRTARVFYVGVVNRPGEDPTTVHVATGSRWLRPSPFPPTRRMIYGRSSGTPASRRSVRRSSGSGCRRSPESSRSCRAPGDTVYGFAAGLYPTDYPTLPDADDEPV